MAEHFISRDDAAKDLLACAAYLSESIESTEGHAAAIAAVVPGYLAKGEVDLAAELANSVDDPLSRERLLILVAEKCSRDDDDEYALQLVEAIEDLGLQSEGRERIGLVKASKGQFDAARKVADEMPHPDFVQAAIALKQYADGDHEGFRSTLSEIAFPAARVSTYQNIVHSKLAYGNADGVTELLEKPAIADAAEIEHDEEKIRAVAEIGSLFIEAKQNGKAIETFDKARGYAEELDNVHRDDFLAAVSVGFLRAGSQDLADRSLDLVADKTQIATCLLGHARHFWANDGREDAVESLEEAYAMLKSQREIETRSSRDRYRLFTSIAVQFAAFGKGERAIEIAENIEDENESMAALGQIAVLLASRGEDELARQALNAIPEDAEKTFALIGMSDAKEKAAEREAAEAFLDKAFVMASTVPQPASRAAAYIEIARRYAKGGDADKFFSATTHTIETIMTLSDKSGKVVSLTELNDLVNELKLEIPPEDRDFLKTLLGDPSRN